MLAVSIKRPVCKLNSSQQRDLFADPMPSAMKEKIKNKKGRVFKSRDAADIYIGSQPLKAYLELAGATQSFLVKEILSKQEWSIFEEKYKGGGRAAYEPKAMLGLILYGIMKGISSLRDLEKMSRLDLGCMWITGGILPDHSIIGRFIQRHSNVLSEKFFVLLTQTVLQETQSGVSSVAGDGTIIEAMTSRFQLIKQEAAEEQRKKSATEFEKNPEDIKLKLAAQKAEQVADEIQKRIQKRKDQRKPTGSVTISSIEPDAVVQPTKKGKTSVPSYKPSVLANDQRIIVAIDVDPSNEINSLYPMIDMANAIGEEECVEEVLLDSGYYAIGVLEESIERNISILCPPGSTYKKPQKNGTKKNKIQKKDFVYDEFTDTYICPQGQRLIPLRQGKASATAPAYTTYIAKNCQSCPVKESCTSSKYGRQLKRFVGDELKDAMQQVMDQPEAKKRFRQRKAMVEPVFSHLRMRQGFNRFRRKGLVAVKVEFALQAMAYNISRVFVIILLFFFMNHARKYIKYHFLNTRLIFLKNQSVLCLG